MMVITGERIQECADIYIGTKDDLQMEKEKHVLIDDLLNTKSYNNPTTVFCYSGIIKKFSHVVRKFSNPFVLITHNGDANVNNVYYVNLILNAPNLKRWYAQNVNLYHDKLIPIPIGIANNSNFSIISSPKTHNIYMCFNVSTNYDKRVECLRNVSGKVPLLGPCDNNLRMSQYKYCICPEGNGLDTHLVWEALYLRVVPIMLRNTHTELLSTQSKLPMILLDSWSFLDPDNLPEYESFDFEYGSSYLDMDFLRNRIHTK
jgi:hypothetical protein